MLNLWHLIDAVSWLQHEADKEAEKEVSEGSKWLCVLFWRWATCWSDNGFSPVVSFPELGLRPVKPNISTVAKQNLEVADCLNLERHYRYTETFLLTLL